MDIEHREKSIKEAKLKAANFCAYQERTQQQVRDKLYDLGMFPNEVEEIIADLILENFINEERFAYTYTQGKFNIKHWGKLKIKYNLQQLGLSDYCIKRSLACIEDDIYEKTLESLMLKKFDATSGKNSYNVNHKVAGFLIRKGYEPDLVWRKIRSETNFIDTN